MMREWKNRLRFLFGRRDRFEDELDEEIRFHLETRIAELVDAGVPDQDARVRARREFGRPAAAREGSRMAWQVRWTVDFATDFRLALRSFRRSPVFAATAVVSLGLGIGGTAAIFSMMDAALWRPLPVREPERLVRLGVEFQTTGGGGALPGALVPFIRDLPVFEGMFATSADGVAFDADGRAERVVAQAVSRNYFEVLGVASYLGRHFTSEGPWAPEVVLSYRFWQRRFGGDPSAIGRTVRLNTVAFTIVGVSPPSFFGVERGRDYEIQIPRLPEGRRIPEISLIAGSAGGWETVMARLRPGVTAQAAESAMAAPLRDFVNVTASEQLRRMGINRPRVLPGGRGWAPGDVQAFETPLFTLLALVGLVLLIACANVAGMLLARAAARGRELAVRCSIGAGRGRLIRQMLAESLALSAIGGAVGLAITVPAGRILFSFLPQGHIGMAVDLRTDARVVLFTLAVMLATGLVFGLAPAVFGTRGNIAAALKGGGQPAANSWLRSGLLAAQAAFAIALLIATGALAQTLARLRPEEFGQSPERVLLFTMKPPPEIYPAERLRGLYAEVARRVSALPGVQSAALAQDGPLGSRTSGGPIPTPGGGRVLAFRDTTGPGLFETTGIRRIAGRDFSVADRPGSPPVAIVNQAFARALFGSANPIGRSFSFPPGPQGTAREIVGVVADVHYFDVRQPPQPWFWLPAEQEGLYMPTLFVKWRAADTGAAVQAVRREIDAVDAGFPVFNVRSFEMRIRDALSRERMMAQFSAALGGLALLMAAVGIYGLLAYAVTRRTREIGIRMALGSRAGPVVWLVAAEGLRPVSWGLAIGSIAAAVVARPGWLPIAGAVVALVIAGVASAVIPAARASRVDPLRALRVD